MNKTGYTYSVLDAARIFGELEAAQTLQTNFLSLYVGQNADFLSSVAPYLFQFQAESEYGNWLLDKGWGNAWGLFIETDATIEELQNHFRKYLMVKTEDGKELYFRFYDPRVLRIFLPTCDAKQLQEFFGPVSIFGMESDDPDFAILFSFEEGKLVTLKTPKIEFWNRLNGQTVSTDSNAEIIIPVPDDKKAKPGKKWNFLID